MTDPKRKYYEKRANVLIKNLHSRHFEACYCADKAEALKKALEWIPAGSSVRTGDYRALDRERAATPEERKAIMKQCLGADVFITGANALSLDGQMVNIDGNGNRVAAIVYGPESVIVIAGMNKVMDSLDAAVERARTVAAPQNKQRFDSKTPCEVTGACADCKSDGCICNQILITRNCNPPGRIKFILVGEDLGL